MSGVSEIVQNVQIVAFRFTSKQLDILFSGKSSLSYNCIQILIFAARFDEWPNKFLLSVSIDYNQCYYLVSENH